jgi:hypothetical protein
MIRLVLGFFLSLALAGVASAQPGIPGNGTHILRGLLKYHGFTPVEQVGQLPLNGTLVVIVGKSPRNPELLNQISVLQMNRSGALVISDDSTNLTQVFPANEKRRGNEAGIIPATVNGRIPATCFGGDLTMPYARIHAVPPAMQAKELFALPQLQQIITRNPSIITTLGNQQYLSIGLMEFPRGARFLNGQPVPDDTLLAAMSDPESRGTMMAFASRAMFSNELMVLKDPNPQPGAMGGPQNFYFSYFLTLYLKNRIVPAPGQPRHVLLVEDGEVVTDFDSVQFVEQPGKPGVPPVKPPLPAILAMVVEKGNEIVAQAQDNDFPHRVIEKNPIPVRAGILSTVAIIATVILCRYLLWRAWKGIRPTNVVPRPKILIEGDGGMISQRRQGLIECGNLFEPMRDHTRLLFRQWGATPGAALPPIKVDRPSRPLHRLVSDLHTLWEIAHGPQRQTITLDDLEDFEEMIQDLTTAHHKGIWQFATPEEQQDIKKSIKNGTPRAMPKGGTV